jgi:hypothetical protein
MFNVEITAKPYRKLYFNDFAQTSLLCKMGIVIFDLQPPKIPMRGQKSMMDVNY